MTRLTLSAAQAIIAGTIAEARGRNAVPLGIIVLDNGGHPLAFAREDGATFFRFDVARAKATGALGLGANTRALAERAATNPNLLLSISGAIDGRVVLSPGGVLILDGDTVIGAVGASGDTGDCDEACVLAGLRAAGFNLESAG